MKNVWLLLLMFATQGLMAQDWQVDPQHTTIQFSVKHMGIAVITGMFEEYEVDFEPSDSEMSDMDLDVKIKTVSLNTKVDQRDEHLRSKDFFYAEKHPEITFKSTEFKKKRKSYELTGELTMRGVTKTVTLTVEKGTEVTGLYGEKRIGFIAKGTVNRMDYGIAFNAEMDNGSDLIAEEVEIFIGVEFMKK